MSASRPRPKSRFDAINAWWRDNRDKAPDLFNREVEEGIERLDASPVAGVVRHVGRSRDPSLPAEEDAALLYHGVEDSGDAEVMTIWGAQRRYGPKL